MNKKTVFILGAGFNNSVSSSTEIDLKVDPRLYQKEYNYNWSDFIISGENSNNSEYKKIFHFISRVMLLKFIRDKDKKVIKIEKMPWKEENSIVTFNCNITSLDKCREILRKRVSEDDKKSLGLLDSLELYSLEDSTLKEKILEKINNANRLVFIEYSLPKSNDDFYDSLKKVLDKAEIEINVICEDKDGKYKFYPKYWENIQPEFDLKNPDGTPIKESYWIEEYYNMEKPDCSIEPYLKNIMFGWEKENILIPREGANRGEDVFFHRSGNETVKINP